MAQAPALVEDPADAPEIAEPSAAIEPPSAPPVLEAAPEPAGAKIVAIAPAAIVAKAPDDPGVHPAAAKRSGFRLFS